MNFVKVDSDTKIAVIDLNRTAKKTVVFIHGWPLDSRIFEYQYDILVKQGYRCVGIDLRGFGQSDATDYGYTYNNLAKDISKVLSQINIGSYTLAGFSMGGAIAVRYLANYHDPKVRKLALLAAAAPCFTQSDDYPYGFKKEEIDNLITQTYIDRPKMCADFGKNFFYKNPSQPLRTWFDNMAVSENSIATIGTLTSLRNEDLRGDMEKIKIKVGAFHGIHDKICPYEFTEEMAKGFDNFELFTFEDSGHAVIYDELENFNKQFLSFLNS